MANEYSLCFKVKKLDDKKMDVLVEVIKNYVQFTDMASIRTGFLKPEEAFENFLNFGLYRRFNLFTVTTLEKMFIKIVQVLAVEKSVNKAHLIQVIEENFSERKENAGSI